MQSICHKPIITKKIGDSSARIAGANSRTRATYHQKKQIKQVKTQEYFLSHKLRGGGGIGHPHREFLLSTKSSGSRSVKNVLFVDSRVDYLVTTSTRGQDPATDVTITDSIVWGLTKVTVLDGNTYDLVAGIVTFGPVAIANAETVTRTIDFTVPPTLTSIGNTARSISITPNSTPANNNGTNPNATVTTSIDAVVDVVTQKTAAASINAGAMLIYTITTSNNEPSPAANVVITDSLIPSLRGVTLSDGGTYNLATGAIDFPVIANLAIGTNQSPTISFVPSPTLTRITNIVSSRSHTPDPDLTNHNCSTVAAPGEAGGRVTTLLNCEVGTDKFVLADGLSFEVLRINSTANGTLLQVGATGEVFAQVFEPHNSLNARDFLTLAPSG
ncbi:hypothetical protein [Microcoleus sp. S13C4]|uniref:hypothetical protein n=1 Tax=Microcoleus sp. S13C4 TaxID=3055410 RepID=UPI002FCEA1EB